MADPCHRARAGATPARLRGPSGQPGVRPRPWHCGPVQGKASSPTSEDGTVPIREDLLHPRRKSPLTLPLIAIALLALLGGAFLLGRLSAPAAVPQPAEAIAAAAGGAGAAGGSGAEGTGGGAVAMAAEPAAIETPMGEVLPGTDGLRRLAIEVRGSLTASINEVIDPAVGDPLALVTSRLLVWWLSPSRDLRPGDRLELLYELPEGEEPVVHAMRFRSHKLDREIRAYRHKEKGARFARYYDESGREIEERLRGGPIDEYEQITSLLRDGRRHKGVDFKAPVGTEVKMPWDGTVVRRNWNYRYNGGSLEVRDGRGRSVIFLHLDSVDPSLKPGSRVRRGQVVARSGNTGRSTAPHLHYQVMAGDRVLDPFELHETWRRTMPAEEQKEFAARVEFLDALLAGEAVAAVAPQGAAIAPAAARAATD
jgi:hypothetical protein